MENRRTVCRGYTPIYDEAAFLPGQAFTRYAIAQKTATMRRVLKSPVAKIKISTTIKARGSIYSGGTKKDNVNSSQHIANTRSASTNKDDNNDRTWSASAKISAFMMSR